MYKVIRYMTNDGKIFNTESEARKKLEKEYGNILEKISHRIIKETDGKYAKLLKFLDENILDFQRLFELKEEIENGLEE